MRLTACPLKSVGHLFYCNLKEISSISLLELQIRQLGGNPSGIATPTSYLIYDLHECFPRPPRHLHEFHRVILQNS